MGTNVKLLIALVFVGLLAGCATVGMEIVPVSEVKDVSIPPLHQEASVELGDAIVSKGKVYTTSYQAMILSNEVHSLEKEAAVIGASVSVPAGELVARWENPEWTLYYSTEGVTISRWMTKFKGEGGLKVYKSDGHVEIFAPQLSWAYSKVPHVKPVFEVKKMQEVEKSKPSFSQELIYNGKVGSSVKFLYREFSDDMVRPAFSQEIQYDLNDSKIIGFKGTRIEVLEASNTNLKYKVLKNFPETQ